MFSLVTFDAKSQGQLAMVIYEWTDAPYLGKITSMSDDTLPVSGIYFYEKKILKSKV